MKLVFYSEDYFESVYILWNVFKNTIICHNFNIFLRDSVIQNNKYIENLIHMNDLFFF